MRVASLASDKHDIETIAVEYIGKWFRHRGFRVGKGHRGFDLRVKQESEEFFIEVKGRSRKWPFINTPSAEVDLLENNPNARLVEVIINSQTKEVVEAYAYSNKDFYRKRILGYALYPDRTNENKLL